MVRTRSGFERMSGAGEKKSPKQFHARRHLQPGARRTNESAACFQIERSRPKLSRLLINQSSYEVIGARLRAGRQRWFRRRFGRRGHRQGTRLVR